MHVSAQKKHKETVLILLDPVHQVNMTGFELLISCYSWGQERKTTDKRNADISAIFCNVQSLRRFSFTSHFFLAL